MCDPVTLAIMAATTAGKAYFDNKAAQNVSDAQGAAQNTFYKDINNQRDKANVQFQNSTQEAGKPADDARLQEAVAARTAASQPTFDQKTLLPGQGDANGAVRSAIVTAQNEGIAKNADLATRRANLDAFGDADLGKNIQLLRDSNRIKEYGDFAGGAYPVLQADQAAAAHAGDKNKATGDLISAIGTVAGAGYGAGAHAGLWGGTDPTSGITWNQARTVLPTFDGPPNPFAEGPFNYGSPNTPF